MQVTVLGCGTNIPNPKKAGASFYVKDGDDSVLLDMGPGSLVNMVKAGIDRFKVENIIFTHLHLDHFSDFLPFLFNRVFAMNIEKRKLPRLNIYGPKGLSRFFKSTVTKFPVVQNILPFIKVQDLWKSKLRISDFKIQTIQVEHLGINTTAIRVEKNSKSIVYSGDTGVCKNLLKILESADLAIMECAFPKDIQKTGHLNSYDVGKVLHEAEVKKVVLTHLYPEAEKVDIKKEVKENFSSEMVVARDLMKIKV